MDVVYRKEGKKKGSKGERRDPNANSWNIVRSLNVLSPLRKHTYVCNLKSNVSN